MEEHQNNTEADVRHDEAASGDGPPKVVRAGSEAKSGRPVLRGSGAGGDGSRAKAIDDGTTEEAARSVLRAGQQALEGAEEATHAAVDAAESTGGGQVLTVWANCVGRAYLRNIQALSDLRHCSTFYGLLQLQSHLLNATGADVWDTNARMLRSVMPKS